MAGDAGLHVFWASSPKESLAGVGQAIAEARTGAFLAWATTTWRVLRRAAPKKARAGITMVLRRSLMGPSALIESTSKIGRWVEDGTGLFGPFARRIYPVTRKALRWPTTAGYRWAKSVAGSRARPWWRPTVDARVAKAEKQIEAAIRKAIKAYEAAQSAAPKG